MSTKISELSELTFPVNNDELVIVDKDDTTMASSGTNKRIKYQNIAFPHLHGHHAGGRLTLQSTVDVPSTDQISKNIIAYTPSVSDIIGLWDGYRWYPVSFTENYLQLSLLSLSDATNYDIFGYYINNNSMGLECEAWSSNTSRNVSLTRFGGIYLKSTDFTRRYLGTFRTTSTTTTEDSAAKRFLWNYYNKVERYFRVVDTTDSWTYNTSSYRPANNSTANRIEFVTGLSTNVVANLVATVNLVNTNFCFVSLGLDSTTTPASKAISGNGFGTSVNVTLSSNYNDMLSGYHYLQWLELGSAGGSGGATNWYGDNGSSPISGITGHLLG